MYAPFVDLDFADADVIFSDNCINLTSGDARTIRVEKQDILNGAFADAADMQARLMIHSLYDTYVE